MEKIPTSQFATSNDGTRIAYQQLGPTSPQPPLVMIVGLSGVKEDWQPLSTNLATRRRIVVIDNRGIGESDVAPGPYTPLMQANDVLAVVNTLGLTQFDLLGHSMGGMIAQTFALNYPQRVRKLILASTSHGGPNQAPVKPESLQAFQTNPTASAYEKAAKVMEVNFSPEWIKQHPAEFEAIVKKSLNYRRSGRGVMAQMAAAATFNAEEEIKTLNMPVLIIYGSDDQLLDHQNGVLLREKIPGACLVSIEKAGHLTWLMDNGQTEQAIENFLNAS
ncbi:MAG TPA: alpha/beta hydrolase [Pseudomonadales bacterium]|nr:alpha/beta hydrolase [Pseudomonadales bacterium]